MGSPPVSPMGNPSRGQGAPKEARLSEESMSKFDVDKANRDLEESGKGSAWVTEHLGMYGESGGAEGHLFDATVAGVPGIVPCLLLTTIGRRSGKKLTSPLFYSTAGEAYIVAGSKGG